eukprot:1331950-Lingulodinium_polyedra.AAC.1
MRWPPCSTRLTRPRAPVRRPGVMRSLATVPLRMSVSMAPSARARVVCMCSPRCSPSVCGALPIL